ncbi:NHL repeat-containing protein [Lojkania enalia]|uniref:NHL repeat-containing protein n=1 Tax=Lojkania enalia TaxID=147567 RepID=A0A9P4K8J5_9PLEO|nr:NHL repeat-containing protein [Didymosphaeria enalia]
MRILAPFSMGKTLVEHVLRGPLDVTSGDKVYQFPTVSWIENVSVRSNGHLLLSMLTAPELRGINPIDPKPKISLIYQFPNATSVLGSAEVKPDIFAVVTANVSLTGGTVPGSYAIWEVDLKRRTTRARKAVNVPANWTLNGLARLSKDYFLGSDSGAGAVYRFNLKTGASKVVIQDATMKGSKDLPFGVNGIRVYDSYLYYDNTGKGLFCRIPINPYTGIARGPANVLADGLQGLDDFAIGTETGTTYLANFVQNSVLSVDDNGEVKTVASKLGGKVFYGPTSVRFGRTRLDRNIAYAVTSGASWNSSDGSFTPIEGGKVIAIKVCD